MQLAPPASWATAPLVRLTYHLQPGVRDPWGNPVADPTLVEARAWPLADGSSGTSPFRRVDAPLADVVRAAGLLADHDRGATYEAHAVLQGADGAYWVTRLHAVSYGGRMEGSPSIDGRLFGAVVRAVDVAPATPGLVAVVGGAGWIPVRDGVAGTYRPLP